MPNALSDYAEAFASVDQLDKLAGFASHYGADFYGLPRNTKEIALENTPFTIEKDYPFLDGSITPLMAGQQLNWRLTQ